MAPHAVAQPSRDCPIHLYVVAGQSNALGRGSGGPLVPFDVAVDVTPNGSLVPLGTGRIRQGSAWPEFALTYHGLSGLCTAFVQTALGSTTMRRASAEIVRADGVERPGFWEPIRGRQELTSLRPLFFEARERGNRALAALRAQGYEAELRGWLWIQGETDAADIDEGLLSVADYEAGLATMVDSLAAAGHGTLHIIQIGLNRDRDPAAYFAVRDAQRNVARASPNAQVVHNAAFSFGWRGLMLDQVHWGQAALDEAGRTAAETILGTPLSAGESPSEKSPQAAGATVRVYPSPAPVARIEVQAPATVVDMTGRVVRRLAPGSHTTTGLAVGRYVLQGRGEAVVFVVTP